MDPEVHPCDRHHNALMSPDLPWHRVLEIADACPNCRVINPVNH